MWKTMWNDYYVKLQMPWERLKKYKYIPKYNEVHVLARIDTFYLFKYLHAYSNNHVHCMLEVKIKILH